MVVDVTTRVLALAFLLCLRRHRHTAGLTSELACEFSGTRLTDPAPCLLGSVLPLPPTCLGWNCRLLSSALSFSFFLNFFLFCFFWLPPTFPHPFLPSLYLSLPSRFLPCSQVPPASASRSWDYRQVSMPSFPSLIR